MSEEAFKVFCQLMLGEMIGSSIIYFSNFEHNLRRKKLNPTNLSMWFYPTIAFVCLFLPLNTCKTDDKTHNKVKSIAYSQMHTIISLLIDDLMIDDFDDLAAKYHKTVCIIKDNYNFRY